MKIDSRPYKITIDGEHYSLVSDECAAHIQKVQAHIEGIIKDLRSKNPHMASNRLVMIAAIQCVSQMIHAQESTHDYDSKVNRISEYVERALAKIA